MRNLIKLSTAALILGLATPAAFAGYYTDVIGGGLGTALQATPPTPSSPWGRNDDGSFGPVALGYTLNYFGNIYSTFFINNNGNVSFGQEAALWTSNPLNVSTVAPMVAPYWSDVDTRFDTISNVYLRQDIQNQVIVTWDQVDHYNNTTVRGNNRASFQLVLRGPDYVVPGGEGQVGFFFKTVGWETGYMNPNLPASVGFGDGLAAINPGEISLPGSQLPGISQVVANNHYWFDLPQGIPTAVQPGNPSVPEPASLALLGLGLGGLAVSRRRKAA